jgi:eukaryotic-like serine/threonine-protein kinase
MLGTHPFVRRLDGKKTLTTQTSASSAGGRAVPGSIIGGRYQLRAAIGNGGMGTVWQALDIVLRRDVAVKEVVLPPGMPPNERDAMHERTLREARAAGALSHPSVVQVYDVVHEDGRPWIVMELLQARSLSEIIISDGPLSGRAVAKIGIALLGALEVAHAAGVLHRDVKPANVLICVDGRCVLTDFGVARIPSESNLTQPGMVLGSPHFISPERAIGAKFGPPSDLFSLGVSLYTAIEGRPPFDRGDPFETMRAIVEDEPLPPVRAGAMAPVLAGLLDKDPERRWTVNQARTALRELMSASSRQNARGVPLAPRMQVGGRALLSDGEGPSLEELAPPSGPPTAPFTPALEPGPAAAPAPFQHTPPRESLAGMPVPPYAPAAPSYQAGAAYHPGPIDPATGFASPPAPRPRRSGAAGSADGFPAKARALSTTALETVKAWPRKLLIGAAASVALLLVVILVVSLSGGGSPAGTPVAATPTASAAPAKPPFETQTFKDSRGMTVNVPAAWKKQSANSYTNFYDPQDDTQRMRLNVENIGSASARAFLTGAEKGLKNRSCDTYSRVGLTDITLDGKPAAQLEYKCGTSDGERHGIWAAVTSGGKAFHFYLTVPEADYQNDLPIYNEMVSSFRLTADD